MPVRARQLLMPLLLAGRAASIREGGTMSKGDANFWLTLHDLAKALESEGKTRSERHSSLIGELLKMRAAASDEMRSEYEFVVDELLAMRAAVRRKRKQ